MYAYLPWLIVIAPPLLVLVLFQEFIGAIILAAVLYGLVFHLASIFISGIGSFSGFIPILGPEHLFFGIVILIASITVGIYYNKRKMLLENEEYMDDLIRDYPDLLDDTDELNRKVKIYSEGQPHKTRIFFWPWFLGRDMSIGRYKWLVKTVEKDLRSSSRASVEEFAEKRRQKGGLV